VKQQLIDEPIDEVFQIALNKNSSKLKKRLILKTKTT